MYIGNRNLPHSLKQSPRQRRREPAAHRRAESARDQQVGGHGAEEWEVLLEPCSLLWGGPRGEVYERRQWKRLSPAFLMMGGAGGLFVCCS